MAQLPPPVRALFASGKAESVVKQILDTHPFSVSQRVMVSREVFLLLLGLKDPNAFSQTLSTEGKMDTQTIESITNILAEQIFVPLQQQMQSGPPPNLPGAMPDNRLLPNHEVGHINVPVPPKPPVPQPPTPPARPIQFTPPPKPQAPQSPVPQPPQAPRVYTNPPPPPPPPPKPIASYSADPYREQFNQNG